MIKLKKKVKWNVLYNFLKNQNEGKKRTTMIFHVEIHTLLARKWIEIARIKLLLLVYFVIIQYN